MSKTYFFMACTQQKLTTGSLHFEFRIPSDQGTPHVLIYNCKKNVSIFYLNSAKGIHCNIKLYFGNTYMYFGFNIL